MEKANILKEEDYSLLKGELGNDESFLFEATLNTSMSLQETVVDIEDEPLEEPIPCKRKKEDDYPKEEINIKRRKCVGNKPFASKNGLIYKEIPAEHLGPQVAIGLNACTMLNMSNDEKESGTKKSIALLSLIESKELNIKKQIATLRKEIDVLQRVKKSRKSNNVDKLIDKWREIGQMAASKLFNEAKIKIERMGGVEEYRIKQNRLKKRNQMNDSQFGIDNDMLNQLEKYIESEEFQNLDSFDQKEIIDKKCELEDGLNNLQENVGSSNFDVDFEDNSFTMEELFRQLKMDIKLFF